MRVHWCVCTRFVFPHLSVDGPRVDLPQHAANIHAWQLKSMAQFVAYGWVLNEFQDVGRGAVLDMIRCRDMLDNVFVCGKIYGI